MCDVDVKIGCFADEARDIPCNQFKPNLSGIRESSCEHALKYVYTVTNSGSGSEAVSGITTTGMQGGTKKNILPGGPFDLEPDETVEVMDVMIVDYCENDFPNGIMNTSIEVMGESKLRLLRHGKSCFGSKLTHLLTFILTSQCVA
jgi:hypothetical protein